MLVPGSGKEKIDQPMRIKGEIGIICDGKDRFLFLAQEKESGREREGGRETERENSKTEFFSRNNLSRKFLGFFSIFFLGLKFRV